MIELSEAAARGGAGYSPLSYPLELAVRELAR